MTDFPRIIPGQTWVSPNPRVRARTVVRVGFNPNHSSWGERGLVYRRADDNTSYSLSHTAFAAWARRSGARPK